jgi:hypothetical protein
MAALLPVAGWAAGTPVSLLGPKTLTRTEGKPDRFALPFSLPSGVEVPFTLKVTNGTPAGQNRISSASVVLNGVEVIKEGAFNPQVAVVERTVSLSATNHLVVELRSAPGSFVSVEVIGTRIEPILKKTIGPAGGTLELQGTLNSVKVEIPAEALAADTELTIRQVSTPGFGRISSNVIPFGNTFSFEPHGLTFSKVVDITFTYRDEDLPVGADEGEVVIYRSDGTDDPFTIDGGAVCRFDEEPGPHCIDTESFAQEGDIDKNQVSVFVNKLSERTLRVFKNLQTLQDKIKGCNGSEEAQPILDDDDMVKDGFNLTILDCPRPGVASRPAGPITRIVLHSTSNGKPKTAFADEVICAIHPDRCPSFAHYYVGRDGTIVRIATDNLLAEHTRTSTGTVFPTVSNDNSIGIEVFNNVGEPYDGRQITALVRLVDMLIRLHPVLVDSGTGEEIPNSGIARPSFPRDLVTTSLFSHQEVDPARRLDPVGTFRTSSEVWYIPPGEKKVVKSRPLEGGKPAAVTLFDAVVAGVSAMGGDFKGLVNTQGGDAMGLAQAGAGGEIVYKGRAAMTVGTNHTDNLPLIVGPGETVVLPTTADYTDVLISSGGVVQLAGDTTLSAGGTVWVGPVLPATSTTAAVPPGRIVTASSLNGNALTLNANGAPLLNGIVDLRGKNAELSPSEGGEGGAAWVATASFGPHFVPTLVTRGGDADDVSCESRQVESSVVCDRLAAGAGGDVGDGGGVTGYGAVISGESGPV